MNPSPSVCFRTCTRMRATTRSLRLVLIKAFDGVVRGSGIPDDSSICLRGVIGVFLNGEASFLITKR